MLETPINLQKSDIKCNEIYDYFDKHKEEYNRLAGFTDKGPVIVADKNGHIKKNIHLNINFKTYAAWDLSRESLLYKTMKKNPMPKKPMSFDFYTNKIPIFNLVYVAPEAKLLESGDNMCVISLETISHGSEYWRCDTCRNTVLHEVYIVYTNGKTVGHECPHCRMISKRDIKYVNCEPNELVNAANESKLKYNAEVIKHNKSVNEFLAKIDAHNQMITDYNLECRQILKNRDLYMITYVKMILSFKWQLCS